MDKYLESVANADTNTIYGILNLIVLGVWLVYKGTSALFKDRSTTEQRALYDALYKRLTNPNHNWEDIQGDLVLFDSDIDRLEIQRHTRNGGIMVGSFLVNQLTRSQKKKIDALAKNKLAAIHKEREAALLNATLRELRRPV